MKVAFQQLCALLVVMLFPLASAGTAANPEVTDPKDVSLNHLDIRKAWITETSDHITIHIQLQDLTSSHPILNGDYRHYYVAQFNVTGYRPVRAEGVVGYFESQSAIGMDGFSTYDLPGATGVSLLKTVPQPVGTTFRAATMAGTGQAIGELGGRVTIDISSNVVKLDVNRKGSHSFGTGLVVTDLIIQTYVGTSAVELLSNPTAGALPPRTLVDDAGPSILPYILK